MIFSVFQRLGKQFCLIIRCIISWMKNMLFEKLCWKNKGVVTSLQLRLQGRYETPNTGLSTFQLPPFFIKLPRHCHTTSRYTNQIESPSTTSLDIIIPPIISKLGRYCSTSLIARWRRSVSRRTWQLYAQKLARAHCCLTRNGQPSIT